MRHARARDVGLRDVRGAIVEKHLSRNVAATLRASSTKALQVDELIQSTRRLGLAGTSTPAHDAESTSRCWNRRQVARCSRRR
jgi:hypothetical protein